MTPLLLSLLSFGPAEGAAGPPRRPIPESVLVELRHLEDRFETALALDCESSRCFSTGCVYVAHSVADRPRSSSLPGLGDEAGIGAVEPQPWLTRAQCGFAHEPAVEDEDVRVLSRRLQSRVSTGWASVSVVAKSMDPLPPYFRAEHSNEPEEAPVEPPPPPPEPTVGEQVWEALLPHLFWMVGLLLFTVAAIVWVWTLRRVGKPSMEEELLLAQMANEVGSSEPSEPRSEDSDGMRDAAYVAQQQTLWARRLAERDGASPERALQALVRDRLRRGDIAFLAKATLRFPEHFPAVFPDGGDVAAAKLALADYLRGADMSGLPNDRAFFEALNRHAVAGHLASQPDADLVRQLREDFGAAGLARTIRTQTPRLGGLLFAWATPHMQHEVGRLLSPRQIASMVEQLLRSNRMDAAETEQLFAVVRGDEAMSAGRVTDQGAALDIAGAVSLLLEKLARETRSELLREALGRAQGVAPTWMRGLFFADMLEALPAEARADLLLGVDVAALAAWLHRCSPGSAEDLMAQMPESLRKTVESVAIPAEPEPLARSARQGQGDLARGFQVQLGRLGIGFESVLTAVDAGAPA